MVIDVHTHTPRFETDIPDGLRDATINSKWNPAGARPLVYTWAEFEEAMAHYARIAKKYSNALRELAK